MKTLYLDSIIKRAGAISADARSDADGRHHIRLRFQGGKTMDLITAICRLEVTEPIQPLPENSKCK